MILLVRTLTLLQKFVALPRDDSTEAHYRLTLRERQDDGFQVIDIQYLDGRVSSVTLERALPGGGTYEETNNLVLEDELLWDSDLDSESGPEGSGTIKQWLRDSYRLNLDWEARGHEADALDSTNSQETGGFKTDLQVSGCDDTSADTEMPLAKVAGRNCKGARDSELGPPTWRPRPIIAPGSSPWGPRLQRQDSLLGGGSEDEHRAPTPPFPDHKRDYTPNNNICSRSANPI